MSSGLATVNPWVAGGALGLSAISALFGHGPNINDPNIGSFNYIPDQNDPELLLRRRRALEEISRDRGSTINELYRSGLGGSGAAFSVLNEGQTAGARSLEDINSDVFAKRRSEALNLYREHLAFLRQKALAEGGYGQQERLMGLEGLGNIGEFGGSLLDRNGTATRRMRYLDPTNPLNY